MKIIALIMSFFVSFLVIEPGVSAMIHLSDKQETHKSCCKHCCNKCPNKENKKQKKNCCDYGDCNPFAMCQCCAGFVVASVSSGILPVSSNCEYDGCASDNMRSHFYPNFWQPPKIS